MKRPRHRQPGKPAGAGALGPLRGSEGLMAEGFGGLPRTSWNRNWLFALLLVAVTLIAYLPVWRAGFIWDDDTFLLANPLIQNQDGLRRLWFSTAALDYFPLTSTTLWLEWRLWGADPLGYHLVNVLLHAFSAVVLWRVLARLKIPGAWLAAAIFALHPVNVESVAWVTERKNTLAMAFYLLSVLWFLRSEERGGRGQRSEVRDQKSGVRGQRSEVGSHPPSSTLHPPSSLFYCLSLVAFLLALLSKTAVAPLPLVLLGVAWWQRGRVERRDVWRSVPFFVTAVAVGLIALWFQYHRAIASEVVRPDSFWSRLAGAGWAIWFYLGKALLPLNLVFVYPRWQIDPAHALSYLPGLLVVGGFLVCWHFRRRWGKAMLFGLGYFVLMLLPVLGFLNIYFMLYSLVADHWQYFAIIGPIALAAAGIARASGGIDGLMDRRISGKAERATWQPIIQPSNYPVIQWVLRGALLVALGVLTWRQCEVYGDVETLWRTTLAANPACWMAENNLGNVVFQEGRVDEALAHFQRALEIRPDHAAAHNNLANALLQKGQVEEAMAHFQKALELRPDYAEAHNDLASVLFQKGRVDEALAHLQKALEIRPDYADVHNNLANILFQQGRLDEAIAHYQDALQIQPGSAGAHYNLADTLLRRGRLDEALVHYQRAVQIQPNLAAAHTGFGHVLSQKGRAAEALAHFEQALAIRPDFAPACSGLAWMLATCPDASVRNGARALELAQRAEQLSGGGNPLFIATLAAAYAEAGRFPEAIETAQRALQLADARNNTALANRLRAQIALYQTGSPYRDTGQAGN